MALVTALRRLAHVRLGEYSRRTAAAASCASLTGHRSLTTGTQPLRSDNKVTVHFYNRDGEKITVKGSPGDSLLDVVINEDLDFDGFGTSRLGCQICLTKSLDGMVARVPESVADIRQSKDGSS
eukprot:superscaffoldBa00003616_g17328